MADYEKVWAALANRAVLQGNINAQSFVEMAQASGMSDEAILQFLSEDLVNNGPIFGPFMRSLEGAAKSSTMAAIRQGETIGTLANDEDLQRLTGLADSQDALNAALESADPALAEALEKAVEDDLEETSIAELRNTCHVCLPLHGKTLTRREWAERGLLPEMRHAGWTSSCKCRLVPKRFADDDELVAPLVRERATSPTGLKPSKKTTRVISESSLERAQREVERSMQTPEGRRTLRLLGQQQSDQAPPPHTEED